jgi:glycosyltransferase involved in cell wall biosynthesis
MPVTSSSPAPPLEPRQLSALPDEPLVSILLANYNYANYIGQSIESVLQQTYSRWELIICDDGSTDNSVAVIESYLQRDHRIRLVRKPNGGHTSVLNMAFSCSSGDIICFLDSDDLYLPRKLTIVVGACTSQPDAGLIVHRVIRVNSELQKLGVWPLSDLPDGWLGPDLLKAGGILPYAPPTSGIALRRETAQILFPISVAPPLHMCPDQVLMRLAPLVTNIKRLPDSLAQYRLHNTNTYSRQGTSAESVTKELALSRALWNEQHRFLSSFDGNAARHLTDLEDSSYTALLFFLKAKLRNEPEVRQYHQRYLAASKHEHSAAILAFWRFSLYLPNTIFRPAVSTMLGQGALKQFISRLRKLV